MHKLRGLAIGAGYFARFHYDAWQRVGNAEIAAVCDLDESKAAMTAEEFGIGHSGANLDELVDQVSPHFVDIITPPPTHLNLVRWAAGRGLHVLCQKPLAPSLDEAHEIVQAAREGGIRFMVHENFRFQPWYREIKRMIGEGMIGDKLFSIAFRSRMGDGWGEDAYLNRQPYFRTMPRMLVYENGVHFIDVFRYLGGDVQSVYSVLRRLNPVIAGEDAALLVFNFAGGTVGIWDANRYNECNDPDPRYTFGEMLVEGDGGTIRLYLDGRITLQPLGEPEADHAYEHHRRGFAGDCVFFALKHFVECMQTDRPFETNGEDYLTTLTVQEAVYESSAARTVIRLNDASDAAAN